jgi:hypothetical protein
MASTHQARSHHAIAKRLDNSTSTVDKRAETFANKEMTWYPTDTGPYVQFLWFFSSPSPDPLLVTPARAKTTKTAITWVSFL